MNTVALSRMLGWFSLALGSLELAVPRTLSRQLGLRGGPWLVRGFGLRELAAGLTILTQPDNLMGPASRVGGDLMDIAVLGEALTRRSKQRGAAEIALALVIGVTGLDIWCSTALVSGERKRHQTALRTRWRADARN